jgi:hypothetical protein
VLAVEPPTPVVITYIRVIRMFRLTEARGFLQSH